MARKHPRIAELHRTRRDSLAAVDTTRTISELEPSFDRLAFTIDAFMQALKIDRYAIYVFDYGAPTGFRLAMTHPDRVTAIVSQNGKHTKKALVKLGVRSESIGLHPRQKIGTYSARVFSQRAERAGSIPTA